MGRDKAGIGVEGQPLWQRQLATLAALGPHEIFISGKADGPYVGGGMEVIYDLHPGCGPLSGLEAACGRMQTPLLCLLAIDLPKMTPSFLERLVKRAMQEGRGVVPQNGEYFEPLAAVYPRAMLNLIREQMDRSVHSMQRLVRQAMDIGLVTAQILEEDERAFFQNVNTPADLSGG